MFDQAIAERMRHTLMTPMFDHGPSPCGLPPIHIAAVGPVMTGVVGEVADGLIAHGFTTPAYLRDVTLPNLEAGLARAGRARGHVEVTVPAMLVLADGDDEAALGSARAPIAFYGSTPAYRGVLDHHGWGALGDELHALSRRGDWAAMPALIDDEVVHAFAVVGAPADVAAEVHRRFGGLVDRVQVGMDRDDAAVGALLEGLRRG